jgi:hypothetical protein
MTEKTYLCNECGVKITLTRPPVYLTYDDGTKVTYDYDPEPPEHCPNGHSVIIRI